MSRLDDILRENAASLDSQFVAPVRQASATHNPHDVIRALGMVLGMPDPRDPQSRVPIPMGMAHRVGVGRMGAKGWPSEWYSFPPDMPSVHETSVPARPLARTANEGGSRAALEQLLKAVEALQVPAGKRRVFRVSARGSGVAGRNAANPEGLIDYLDHYFDYDKPAPPGWVEHPDVHSYLVPDDWIEGAYRPVMASRNRTTTPPPRPLRRVKGSR